MKTPSTGSPSTPVDVDRRLEGLVLPAEGVAADDHVDAAEGLLARARVEDLVGEHDHAGAGAVDRQPRASRARSGSIRPKSTASLEMVVDSPPGMTRPSTSASSSGRRTGLASGVRRGQGDQVLPYVALEGQDAYDGVTCMRDMGAYQPRLA